MRGALQADKQKVFYVLTSLYCLFAGLYMLGDYLSSDILRAFKIVPFAILLVPLVPDWRNPNSQRLILGIAFGALGDEILEYGRDHYFNLGAASFLVGHIFYNISIMECWRMVEMSVFWKKRLLFFLGCVTFFSLSSINLATTLKD